MEIENITHPKQLSPLVLAFLGDAVFELMVRAKLVARGNAPIGRLHRQSVEHVCASAQSEGVLAVQELLTEEELAMYKRGRNTHNNTPKNADPMQYRCATGLETLFGYLYVTEQHDRAKELFEKIWSAISEE